MTRYVGLDVHQRFVEVCILEANSNAIFRGKANCRREELVHFARGTLKRSDRLVLKATTNTCSPAVRREHPIECGRSPRSSRLFRQAAFCIGHGERLDPDWLLCAKSPDCRLQKNRRNCQLEERGLAVFVADLYQPPETQTRKRRHQSVVRPPERAAGLALF